MAETEVPEFLDGVGAAEVVTIGAEGYPVATLMPFIREDDRLLLHMARANPHWRSIGPRARALAIVAGPQAYVSPAWYATKREHGRVVPTWNYTAVHLTGTVTVHEDAAWLRDVVTRLTSLHERGRPEPWAVTDPPEGFVDKELRAIVGIELRVERMEAKAKLSQNRSEQDRSGVITGLESDGGPALAVAQAMRALEAD